MKKQKIAKKGLSFEYKMILISLAVILAFGTISPDSMLYAFNSSLSEVVDAEFSEVLAEDKMSATIELKIKEKENQKIQAVVLPDETVVNKEEFSVDDEQVIHIQYLALENGEHTYTVKYTEKTSSSENMTEPVVEDEQSKEEKIVYEVEQIKTEEDMKLDIIAEDITFQSGDSIDILKGIVIKNEEGTDITSTSTINVKNYGSFLSNVAGIYPIEYSVVYNETGKEAIFSRNVEIVEKATKGRAATRTTNSTGTAKIQLASTNVSLKQPEDFLVGNKDQDSFDIAISADVPDAGNGRMLSFMIPAGFTPVSELTADMLTNVDKVEYITNSDTSTEVRIYFKDGVAVQLNINFRVKQQKENLYTWANAEAKDYVFVVNNLVLDEVKAEQTLTLHVDKLKSLKDNLSIDPINKIKETRADNWIDNTILVGNYGPGYISIKKKAYTSFEKTLVKIPRNIEGVGKLELPFRNGALFADVYNNDGNKIESFLICEGNVADSDSYTASYFIKDDDYYYFYIQAKNFKYAYEDMELRLAGKSVDNNQSFSFMTNDYNIYDNPTTPWQTNLDVEVQFLESGLSQTYGKIIINPIKNEQPTGQAGLLALSQNIIQGREIQGIKPIVTNEIVRSPNAVMNVEFPYEIQVNEIAFYGSYYYSRYVLGTQTFSITTNKGRTFEVNQTVAPLTKESDRLSKVDIKPLLLDGEYVKKISYTGYFHEIAAKPNSSASNVITFNGIVKKVSEDNQPLVGGQKVIIKNTYAMPDYSYTSSETSNEIILKKNTKDTMEIKPIVKDDQDLIYVGKDAINLSLGGVTLKSIDSDVKDYSHAEISFTGSKVLSLTRGLDFTGRGISISSAKVRYNTNKRTGIVEVFSTIHADNAEGLTNNLALQDDEYITALVVELDGIENIYTGSIYPYINVHLSTGNKVFPDTLPLDGASYDRQYSFQYQADLDGKAFANTGLTSNIVDKLDKGFILKAGELVSPSVSSPNVLFGVGVNGTGKYDYFDYENLNFDFSTSDPELLSLIGTIYNDSKFNGVITYKTNKGTTGTKDMKGYGEASLKLGYDEYLVALSVHFDALSLPTNRSMNGKVLTMMRRLDYLRTNPYNGKGFTGTSASDGTRYDTVVKYSSDNGKSREDTGGSAPIIGVQEAQFVLGDFVNFDSKATLQTDASYPGQAVTLHYSNLPVTIKDTNPTSTFNSQYRIVDPIIYFIVHKDYSVDVNKVKIDGFDADITFEDGVINDENSLLTIKLKNYEKVKMKEGIADILPAFDIPFIVKPDATARRAKIVQYTLVDLNNSIQSYKDSPFVDLTGYGTNAAYPSNMFGIADDKPLYQASVKSDIHTVLSVSATGVEIFGQVENGGISKELFGRDNNMFYETVNIYSNSANDMYDWKIYIPVPKKGQQIVNGATMNTSDYSMVLTDPIDISALPSGTKVAYTTDSDPKYSLNDTPDTGNYVDVVSNLDNVTMIRITIPKVNMNTALMVKVPLKMDGYKKVIGDQVAYAGAYYNAKSGSSSSPYVFNGDEGAKYGDLKYVLKDYEISGILWEEEESSQNNLYDKGIDSLMLKKSKISALDMHGNTYETEAENGKYTMVVPTHGDVILTIDLPNDSTSLPKQMYRMVVNGNTETSSAFDMVFKQAYVNLDKDSVDHINAGMWAIRDVAVHGNSITIKKGETIKVPALTFPSGINITYSDTKDNKIAIVSADGKATGVKVGKTTATVSIPDGEGDIVTTEYEIHVVPVNSPSVTTNPIYMFEGNTFDSKADITILDGDGNVMDLNDHSKINIDETAVDTTTAGRYPIVYTVNDGYNEITYTRFVYVYGNVVLVEPAEKTLKTNVDFVPTENASASYMHVNEDGTMESKPITVTTTLGFTKTPATAQDVTVPLLAEVTLHGVSSRATGDYVIHVNEPVILTSAEDDVIVKVNATLDDIKAVIQAEGSMQTPKGKQDLVVDWSNFNDFDTSKPGNTMTANISVNDPDTGKNITKEITITISKHAIITAPDVVELVEGDKFDPASNVIIEGGDGQDIAFAPSMITRNEVLTDASGNTTTLGNYYVTYEYIDGYGNKATAKTLVKVHGTMQNNLVRADQLLGDSTSNINDKNNLENFAWYLNSDGDKKKMIYVSSDTMNADVIGKATQSITFRHPINGKEKTLSRDVYTHGVIQITVPAHKNAKVNENVDVLDGVRASYTFVKDDGTTEEKTVTVSSTLGSTITSVEPAIVHVPVIASTEVVPGLTSTSNNQYDIVFNGYPVIKTKFDSITVKVNATQDDIKKIFQASAYVQYGQNAKPTDLTDQINWDELLAIDTSVKDVTYTIIIHVTDDDGAKVEKTLSITISDGIIINLPNVDKIVGDPFDPFEDVFIFDANGNRVDPKDAIVDDSKVDMSKPGSYDVTYTYTDEFGNTKTETNTIKVNGDLEFEGLGRVDLIQADKTYISNLGTCYYIDFKGNKIDVIGTNDKNIDQNKIGKHEVTFIATHPVNGKERTAKRNVYVHGNITFNGPSTIIGKVNTTVSTTKGISASYKHVQDDGTITNKEITVKGFNVTSDEVGSLNRVNTAEVEIVKDLTNKAEKQVTVLFNGLPFINASSSLYFKGEPSQNAVIQAMGATAGMKEASGYVIDLTSKIDYSNIKKISLNKSGKYTVTITVKDTDGFTTYKDIEVVIDIPNTNVPSNPNNSGGGNNNTGDEKNDANNQPSEEEKVEDVITVITKDIPLSKTEKGITDNLIKDYITATSKEYGNIDFNVVSHTVQSRSGVYEVTIQLPDGTLRTVEIHVADDSKRDIQQPEFGRNEDCFIQWILLLLLLSYGVYGITLILKRRHELKDLKEGLKNYNAQDKEEVK